jgi:hypothetical protein
VRCASCEDQQLFERLSARGLVRLGADGLAELAPADLVAWRAAGPPRPGMRSPPTRETRRLLEQLYRRADGDFVREQVRIFNAERRLLAWRLRAADEQDRHGAWRAEAWTDAARAGGGAGGPWPTICRPRRTRLFARLPQGWAPWRRIAAWPQHSGGGRLRLQLDAPRPPRRQPAPDAGRTPAGYRRRPVARAGPAACDGRACRAVDEVQELDLLLLPGARELVLDAAPLGIDALATPGDARYRHLAVRGGKLAWQALAAGRGAAAGVRAPRWRYSTATARRCGWRRADPRPRSTPAWRRCSASGPIMQQRGRHAGAPAGVRWAATTRA